MTRKTSRSQIQQDHGRGGGAGRVADVLRAFTKVVAGARGGEAGQDHAEAGAPEAGAARQPAAPGGSPAPLPGAPGEPRTLRTLGLPPALASDLEATFRAMGATRGGRVVGFEFQAPDGSRYPVLLEEDDQAGDRAA